MLALLLLIGFAVVLLACMARQLQRPSGWFGRRVMAPLLNAGNRDLLDSALDVAAPTPGARVVDVGFGGGYALDRLTALVSPERVTGVEISEAMIAALRHRCGDAYDLHLADATALPVPDASFDVLLSVNTLYFWPDPARVLAEAKRVLRPGGRLVLGYRSRAILRMSPVTWFGFRVYSDRRVETMLEEAGFAAKMCTPRPGERIAVGTKGLG
jgi:arsenite methyltransferase